MLRLRVKGGDASVFSFCDFRESAQSKKFCGQSRVGEASTYARMGARTRCARQHFCAASAQTQIPRQDGHVSELHGTFDERATSLAVIETLAEQTRRPMER